MNIFLVILSIPILYLTWTLSHLLLVFINRGIAISISKLGLGQFEAIFESGYYLNGFFSSQMSFGILGMYLTHIDAQPLLGMRAYTVISIITFLWCFYALLFTQNTSFQTKLFIGSIAYLIYSFFTTS